MPPPISSSVLTGPPRRARSSNSISGLLANISRIERPATLAGRPNTCRAAPLTSLTHNSSSTTTTASAELSKMAESFLRSLPTCSNKRALSSATAAWAAKAESNVTCSGVKRFGSS
jgi:hypothetical protein